MHEPDLLGDLSRLPIEDVPVDIVRRFERTVTRNERERRARRVSMMRAVVLVTLSSMYLTWAVLFLSR